MKKLLLIFSLLLCFTTMNAWEVWFYNSSIKDGNWKEVYVYTWHRDSDGNDTTVGPPWPGRKMTNMGNRTWYFQGEGDPTHIIFNNGEGTQTKDLEFYNDCYYYYAYKDGVSVKPEDLFKYYIKNDFLLFINEEDLTCELQKCINPDLTKITIPPSVYLKGNDYKITTIIGAFNDYVSASEIEIPNTVISIYSSFSGCTGLKKINIPSSVENLPSSSFKGCSNLEEIVVNWEYPIDFGGLFDFPFDWEIYNNAQLTIPENTWENYVISRWSMFSHIVGPDMTILPFNDGTYSYRYAKGTEKAYLVYGEEYSNFHDKQVSIPNRIIAEGQFYKVVGISDYAFNTTWIDGNLIIPDYCEYIGQYAFHYTDPKTVTIPPALKRVGYHAFYLCDEISKVFISDLSAWCKVRFDRITTANPLYYAHNLYLNDELITNLVIPDDVTEIKFSTFYNAKSIKSITIPSSVKSIAEYSIGGTGIKNINIPSSVKEYNGLALNGCESLKTITFDQSDEDLIVKRGSLLQGLQATTLNLGRNLILNEDANSGATTLTEINFGGSISTINDGLFAGNKNLPEIVIPSSVTYIGESAFENCGLMSISIGAGLEEIGNKAFYGCYPYTMAITALEPPMAENTVFSYIKGNLMVTPGCEEDYYNNPNCWYQFDYPSPLVVAKDLKVESVKDENGNVKLIGTVEPADASLPYVIWKSTDVNSAVIDPDGSVHFINGASTGSLVGSTLYADGPVVTVTVKDDGSITSVEGGDAGVDGIEAEFNGTYHVYSIQGINIMNTQNVDDLNKLQKGIYIINGKKVKINK